MSHCSALIPTRRSPGSRPRDRRSGPSPGPWAAELTAPRLRSVPFQKSGPAWTSSSGGRIDARVRLQFLLPPALEGGAAIDASGRLLGLAVADPRRRALVIPAATVGRSVAQLAERGYVGRGYLGLALQPLRRGQTGLIAVEVAEGGPAASAGLLVGDIVTTWEGEDVGPMRALSRRLGSDAIGSVVRLGLVRAGQPLELTLTIGERRLGAHHSN